MPVVQTATAVAAGPTASLYSSDIEDDLGETR